MSASSVVDVADAFDLALERMVVCGFDELGVVDKILVAIWGVEAEVNNGGFSQFYINSAGDNALETPAALREIGAERIAGVVLRVDRFGNCITNIDRRHFEKVAQGGIVTITAGPHEVPRLVSTYDESQGPGPRPRSTPTVPL